MKKYNLIVNSVTVGVLAPAIYYSFSHNIHMPLHVAAGVILLFTFLEILGASLE